MEISVLGRHDLDGTIADESIIYGSCRSAASRVGTLATPIATYPATASIRRILGTVLAAGSGQFDLELIGPNIEAEATTAVPAPYELNDMLEALARNPALRLERPCGGQPARQPGRDSSELRRTPPAAGRPY
jgi:hypothetical protein